MNDNSVPLATVPIERLRQRLLKDHSVIQVTDLGAGSVRSRSDARQVATICRHTSKSRKYALLLHRMVAKYQPATILELGTSLGISTAYLATANPAARLITIEGSENVARVANKNLDVLELANVEVHEGGFDEVLPGILNSSAAIDFAFIDGNHREEPTLRYFEWLVASANPSTIMVFDDIHWSRGMDRAWQKLKADPRVRMSIDLFFVGILLFREEFKVKQDFAIRF